LPERYDDGGYTGATWIDPRCAKAEHLVVAGLGPAHDRGREAPPGETLVKLKSAELGLQLQSAIDRIAKDPTAPGATAPRPASCDTVHAARCCCWS